MKRFIYVCAFFLCLCSCSESKYIAEELERTQEIINDYPDSALHSLQAIVPGSIFMLAYHLYDYLITLQVFRIIRKWIRPIIGGLLMKIMVMLCLQNIGMVMTFMK